MFIKLFKFYWRDAFNIRSVSFLLALLIITAVIALGLPTERDSGANIFEPVHLSVVDDDKSIISYTLIDQFKSLEVVGTIYVEPLDKALSRLDTGETLLVLVIPTGFYEETRLGLDRSSLTVYLNEAMPAEATVFVRMLDNATASVEGIQSAIYAYQDTLGLILDSPSEIAAYVEAASVDLAFKLVGRKAILQVDESRQLDTVYFVISALSCLLAALTSLLLLMQIRQTRESGLHERLLIAGAQPTVILLVKQLNMLIWLTAGLLPLSLLLRFFYPQINLLIFFSALLLLALTCSGWLAAFSYLSQLRESHLITAWLGLLLVLLAGGCLYPYALLPNIMQTTSFLSPARWTQRILYNMLANEAVQSLFFIALMLHVLVSQIAARLSLISAKPLKV